MEVSEKSASTLRRYFVEVTVIALASTVFYLFTVVNSLNVYIRTEQAKQNVEQAKVIERNTEAFNMFSIQSNIQLHNPNNQKYGK